MTIWKYLDGRIIKKKGAMNRALTVKPDRTITVRSVVTHQATDAIAAFSVALGRIAAEVLAKSGW